MGWSNIQSHDTCCCNDRAQCKDGRELQKRAYTVGKTLWSRISTFFNLKNPAAWLTHACPGQVFCFSVHRLVYAHQATHNALRCAKNQTLRTNGTNSCCTEFKGNYNIKGAYHAPGSRSLSRVDLRKSPWHPGVPSLRNTPELCTRHTALLAISPGMFQEWRIRYVPGMKNKICSRNEELLRIR